MSEYARERAERAEELAQRCIELRAGRPITRQDVDRAVQRAEQSRLRADDADHRADAAQIRVAQGRFSAATDAGGAAEQAADSSDPPELGVEDGDVDEAPLRAGWFHFYFDEQRWEWSRQVQWLHGYQPGTVTPTTELVLSHKHPDDRDRVAATIDDITHNRGAFSSRHRIIDTHGEVHWVIVVGDQLCDDGGAVIGTHGCYVDVTPDERRRQEVITERVAEIAANRAVIEHVKGMLMLIYDVDDDVAFGLLKWLSQENNVKLRRLAEQISTDLRITAQRAAFDQSAFDRVLMTARQRITDDG